MKCLDAKYYADVSDQGWKVSFWCNVSKNPNPCFHNYHSLKRAKHTHYSHMELTPNSASQTWDFTVQVPPGGQDWRPVQTLSLEDPSHWCWHLVVIGEIQCNIGNCHTGPPVDRHTDRHTHTQLKTLPSRNFVRLEKEPVFSVNL